MKLASPVRLYVAFIVALGAAVAALVWALYPPAPGLTDLYLVVTLAAMVAVARRFPLQVAPKTKVLVDTSAIIAAVLLLNPALAVTTCTVGKGLGQAWTKGRGFQKAFNTASTAVQTGLSAIVYNHLMEGRLVEDLARNILPIAFTALLLYALNVIIIEGVVSLQMRRRPFYRWLAVHGQEVQHEGSMYLLGIFGAVIGSLHPWALLLLIMPTAVIYRSLAGGKQLEVQTRETVEALADIVDMRDHYTFEHSRRVAEMARELALALKLSPDEAEVVYTAARVHDVGKIGIKGQILLKEGKLTEEEWREMRTHPEVGAKLVENLPEFRKGRQLILAHHERFDGRGYPNGLRGAQIPFGARIITVADAYDAMTSHRAYRRAQQPEYVVEELRRGRGTQFDPAVVDAFLTLLGSKSGATLPSLAHRHAEPVPA